MCTIGAHTQMLPTILKNERELLHIKQKRKD